MCALFLDFLGVLLVDVHEVVICIPNGLQQFVELGMNGLSVTMLGALDEECHPPSRERSERMPFQSISQDKPAGCVSQEDDKCRRPRGGDADFGKPALEIRR